MGKGDFKSPVVWVGRVCLKRNS